MSTKTWIWIGIFVGSTVGGYLPVLFGQDVFSNWSIFGSFIGGLFGIWAGYKVGNYLI
ncbi:hypothetical protein KGQ71_01745 [Patescibacteria group bacterium]|nr:hypothetical protein [Patescibacteria group bacterium]